MKVVAFNGSTRGSKGNTHACLEEVARTLREQHVDVEIVSLAEKRLNPCKACYACKGKRICIQDDDINDLFQKMLAADGIILASPTYFSNVSSRMQMLIERTGIMARTNDDALKGKVGASVAVARRAGENFVYAAMNYFFGIGQMPIATSSYWNVAFGREPGEVMKDEEGMNTMRTLGKNIATLLFKLRA